VSQMICSVCRNHNQNRKGPDCDYHRGVERVTRRVSHVKQELFTLPEHLSSPPIFSEVRVARSLVFNVMLCRPLFVLLSFFFWPLYCLFFFDLRLLITSLWYLLAIVLSVLLRFTASDYPFGIFWPLYCLFFFDLRLLITPLVYFGHCIVCSSSIYSF
jgi:hypothetical protein